MLFWLIFVPLLIWLLGAPLWAVVLTVIGLFLLFCLIDAAAHGTPGMPR